jgi:hypothetical protein
LHQLGSSTHHDCYKGTDTQQINSVASKLVRMFEIKFNQLIKHNQKSFSVQTYILQLTSDWASNMNSYTERPESPVSY